MMLKYKTFTIEITNKEAETVSSILADAVSEKRKALDKKQASGEATAAELDTMQHELEELKKMRNNSGFLCGVRYYGE